MSYTFGQRSQRELATVDERLQRVFKRALSWQIMDFAVIQGHRSAAEQAELVAKGLSRVKFSKHNHSPSLAVDVAPYPIDWDDKFRFHILAGIVYAAAEVERVPIRWGGDWDGDMSQKDHTFIDMPHFEIEGRVI